ASEQMTDPIIITPPPTALGFGFKPQSFSARTEARDPSLGLCSFQQKRDPGPRIPYARAGFHLARRAWESCQNRAARLRRRCGKRNAGKKTTMLVVLSGCSSGRADTLPASGLMGLTRAWLAGGARANRAACSHRHLTLRQTRPQIRIR